MFTPIFDITMNTAKGYGLWAGTLVSVVWMCIWIATAVHSFITDSRYKSPLTLSDAPLKSLGFDMFLDHVIAISLWLIVLPFMGLTLVPVVNWFWFPLTVIVGIIAIMFIARGVVRLKKSLDAHKADINAHKG